MSAFVVTTSTIAAIVTYAERRLWPCAPPPPHVGVGTVNFRDIDPDRIGQALLAENIRSVNYRYRRNDRVPPYRHVPTYAGAVSPEETRTLTPLDVIKLCQCIEYQSCEHPEWETSWARSFLQRVIDTAVNDLPGYDDAPWGLCSTSHGPEERGSADERLIDAGLPHVFSTLSDANLSDHARRDAVECAPSPSWPRSGGAIPRSVPASGGLWSDGYEHGGRWLGRGRT